MKSPSEKECEMLLDRYGVPDNIRSHTQAVRKVAVFLAGRMAKKGIKLDVDVVDRAALLHDILKMHCVKNGCHHAMEAGKLLASLGYAELGNIVKLHNLEDINLFDSKTSLEAKIVWYADKRVNHDKVVLLLQRYEYLKKRYGSASEGRMNEIEATQKPAFALESELLSLAGTDEYLGGLCAKN